jgi:hypothetical protein
MWRTLTTSLLLNANGALGDRAMRRFVPHFWL